jgi:biopolymer transport protein ExbB
MKKLFLLFTLLVLLGAFPIYIHGQENMEKASGQPAKYHPASSPDLVSINPLLEWFKLGGIFMYPILALSILALGVIIERAIVFRREKLHILKKIGDQVITLLTKEKKLASAISYLETFKGNVCAILARGLKMTNHGIQRVEKTIETQAKLEVSLLENKLNILSIVGTTAPLLGFLGTVSGMISAFQSIANAEQVSAQIVASGIYEALITTEYGLMVAIPVFFIANYFYHRIDTFASEMERTVENIINLKLTHNINKLEEGTHDSD